MTTWAEAATNCRHHRQFLVMDNSHDNRTLHAPHRPAAGLTLGIMRLLFFVTSVGFMALTVGCEQRHLATDACINNLRQIDGAKQQWMSDHRKTTNDVPTWEDLREYIRGIGTTGPMLVCPAGGTYTIGQVGEKPTCTNPRHRLP